MASIGDHAARLLSVARIGQFVAIGGVGAACDMGLLAVLHGMAGVENLFYAKVISSETAIVVMFALNERFTFAGEGDAGVASLARRFLKSNAVRVGGLAVGTGVLLALSGWFGVWYLAANAIGLAAGVGVNYVAESLLTWQVHR